MSLTDWIRERGAELAGKIGIAGIVSTEAGKAVGIFDNVSIIQVISGAGVLIMIVERSFNLYWNAKEKGNERAVKVFILSFWLMLAAMCMMVGL